MLPYRPRETVRIEDYRVRPEDRPGWVRGTARLPREGEEVFCAAGLGVVEALGGRTGDGSRLVHIGLPSSRRRPYYAAASNVLLPPLDDVAAVERRVEDSESPAAARSEVWIGGSEPARF